MKHFLLTIAMLLLDVCISQAADYHFIVAQDGTGDYTTVQAAINAVPSYSKNGPTRIKIKRGVYKEKITIPPSKVAVQLYGEDGVVLTYDAYASQPNILGNMTGTSGSGSIYIFGPDFYAENITFQNSAGPVGQAVACHVAGDKAFFRHCRFLGYQDTLYTFGLDTREYFEDCYIEGTIDFIFGRAQAVFNRCQIHSKASGYLTAPATPQGKSWGYIFYDCKLTADEGVQGVFLGRPWRPYGQSVFIRCHMGEHIVPEGWNNWDNPDNERTAYFAEYQSTGPGAADLSKRAKWVHQLETIDQYDIHKVLNGSDGWDPTMLVFE